MFRNYDDLGVIAVDHPIVGDRPWQRKVIYKWAGLAKAQSALIELIKIRIRHVCVPVNMS